MKKLMAIVALGLLGSVAYAHTELSASMPADKAVLEAAPKQVMLHFTEPVRLTALTIQKQGDAKRDVGPLPAQAGKDFALAAPELGTGAYVVSWRALSEDTHAMTGEFSFTVGAAGAQAPHSEPAGHSGHSQPH